MVRIKHRYLLVNILYPEPPATGHGRDKARPILTLPDSIQFHWPTPDSLTPQILAKAIRNQILYMYGDYGYGITSTGLNATSTAIVRCSRANYRIVWAALTSMTHLPELPKQSALQPCVMQVVRVSGTIRKAEEEVIRRARAAVLDARTENSNRSSNLLDSILGADHMEIAPEHPKNAADLAAGIESDDDDDSKDGQDFMGDGRVDLS
ncbi:MAG: hypothetical protein Q9216_002822 [Gyalolechia sp. 2 TL-2023]